ncbi:MAG: hypothetical protein A2138_07760 [Deltaproteobacteria bacterium RBG_16_71_12]|nr:MAG: hypothetical protein A2138_07760 [Deltaproteobacteria bacterium RBG_16_71_12]
MRGDPEAYRALIREPDGTVPVPARLSLKELAVLTALCDRLVPATPGLPSAKELGIARRIDRELVFLRDKLADDVKAALFLFEHGGLVHGTVSRFCALDDAGRDRRLVEMWGGGALERSCVSGMRILALFFTYADERTWRHIGYTGPLVGHRSPPAADSSAPALASRSG